MPAVPIIGVFSGTVMPLFKAMMSQIVEPDERGAPVTNIPFDNFYQSGLTGPIHGLFNQ